MGAGLARGASPWLVAADIRDPAQHPVTKYRYDPVAFAHDAITWAEGEGPTGYQDEILAAIVEHGRVAVRGPHGLGKTATDAWAVLWFAITRDVARDDWKVPTTASAWRQLTHYLWPEIRKWARRLDWERLGLRQFSDRDELLSLSLKLHTGEAFAVASDDPASIEGAHGDQLFYLFDEAKSIPPGTFDAAEGAFSGAGTDTAIEAYALANSTPGDPNGRFFEIHQHKPGLEDWHTIHVTLDDAIKAGRISREWAEQRARQWTPTSAVYLNRVAGEFAASDEDSVVPLAWIEAANDRWRAAHDGCTIDAHDDACVSAAPFYCTGVDVARSGNDQTVQALRYGWEIRELRHTSRENTMKTTGRVRGVLRSLGGYAIVDVIGIGAGVVDRLRELGHPTIGFNASERTDLLDSSGELGFTNKRSAAWWSLRELLDPDSGVPIALPPDDLLVGDLTAPKWRLMSGGRIQVESKDEIRKRLGRSTDDGDAVVQAYWSEPVEVEEIVELDDESVTISQF